MPSSPEWKYIANHWLVPMSLVPASCATTPASNVRLYLTSLLHIFSHWTFKYCNKDSQPGGIRFRYTSAVNATCPQDEWCGGRQGRLVTFEWLDAACYRRSRRRGTKYNGLSVADAIANPSTVTVTPAAQIQTVHSAQS